VACTTHGREDEGCMIPLVGKYGSAVDNITKDIRETVKGLD
jgi:hypothetical protein